MASLPRPAQYLLRIDDVCPTVHRESWEQLVSIVREHDVRPILAVVPDNHDPDLRYSPAHPRFWKELRELEADGAAIGLHGFRHVCVSRGRSMIPLHRETEFAGLPFETQRERIRAGLRILRDRSLYPRLWVAPRHGFDRRTLAALREEDILYLSDGMARTPYLREGVVWVPQQLWKPVSKETGLWTICLHPGPALMPQLEELRAFLSRYSAQFTSFDRVRREFPVARLDAAELLYEKAAMLRLRLRLARKRRRPSAG